MPVYNAEAFLQDAIWSVLAQTHSHWELIIINDGSTDRSGEIIANYQNHERVIILKQKNKGVAAARNRGLAHMKGDFFCFLDADDILPPRSIESRLEVLQANSSIMFADGAVEFFDSTDQKVLRLYKPDFVGNPLNELFMLSGKCFAGLTWMVRRTHRKYIMREEVRHGEDLLFLMELTRKGGDYGYTPEVVLRYRQHNQSAMRDLDGLQHGYWQIFGYISNWKEFTWRSRWIYKTKVKKFMFLDYIKKGAFGKALAVLMK